MSLPRCVFGVTSALAIVGLFALSGACGSEGANSPAGVSDAGSGASSSHGGAGAASSGGGGSSSTTSTTAGGGAAGGGAPPAEYCFEDVSPPYYNTSGDCTSEPSIDRYAGTQVISWKGHSYLFVNVGSNLSILNVDEPATPTNAGFCHFGVPNVGDKDVDLFGFSVCEDCRFGVAVLAGGTVLFDLGQAATPAFQSYEADTQAHGAEGAFTFEHGGKQYLIASFLPNGCATGDATVYEFNTLTSANLVQVGCVQRPSAITEITAGLYVGQSASTAYLYLIDNTPQVHVYRVTTAGASIALEYVDQGAESLRAFRYGLAMDASASPPLVVTADSTFGTRIYDVSNPASPQRIATIDGTLSAAAVRYPFLWTGRYHFPDTSQTYDISDPSAPAPLDQGFWDPTHPWNAYDCERVEHGAFALDGSALFLARFSILQTALLTECGTGAAAP